MPVAAYVLFLYNNSITTHGKQPRLHAAENDYNVMHTVVLACKTLEDEISKILSDNNRGYSVVWLESGLHNQPEQLREHIKSKLSAITASRVLLSIGYCGGVSIGLQTKNFELIIPKADDCISLLMGSIAARHKAGCEAGTYFLSAGWLRSAENIFASFETDCQRYGRQMAQRAYSLMLKNYHRFALIETQAYSPDDEMEKIRPLSELLNISIERLPGNLNWLKQLISGPWDDGNFIVVPAWSEVKTSMWSWLK